MWNRARILLHFTCKERDAESGLDDFGARYLGSSMGRFLSPDFTGEGTIVRQYICATGLTGGAKHSYPLFPNRHGGRLTRAGITYILDKCVESARNKNPGVLPEVISPHCFRHSKAMHLLHAGVNLVYIRDILGHADLKTTEIYARIDGEMKRKALEEAFANTVPPGAVPLWH
jgi:integrase/recombinase XerD